MLYRGDSLSSTRLADRSAWLLVVLFLLSLLELSPTPAAAQLAPSVGGQWGPVLPWPHVPVSMANLPDGRILTYASNERNRFPGSQNDEYTHAAVYDPTTGEIVEIPHPSHDMFCASMVMTEDGQVFVTGGRNQGNSPWTSLFDFHTNQWIPIENMNRGRWYPTSVYLGSGQVMIAGGVGGGIHPEIWTPGSGWKLLTDIDLSSTILQLGENRDGSGSWPLIQLALDGKLFHHGATDTYNWLDPIGQAGFGELIPIAGDPFHISPPEISPGVPGTPWFPDEGISVTIDKGLILVAGGSTSTSNSTAVSDAFLIDINAGAPATTRVSSMNSPRQFMNEVLLPNGDVLAVGGNTSGAKFTDSAAVRAPEAWDRNADQWTLYNPQIEARSYHSTALLLTDGRVISAGGGLNGNANVDHWNAEIFSPPYLFASDGSPAVRPEIFDSPGILRVGRTFTVQATPGLTRFSMIRMAATTHTMNTDQRYLSPTFTETAPGLYDITLESNENVLVPGFWMLFALDEGDTPGSEVPSVSRVIQIVSEGTPQGPPIQNLRGDVGENVVYQMIAEDPDGNPLSYSAVGLPDGLSISALTGSIQGTFQTAGIFNPTVFVDDGDEVGSVSFSWIVSSQKSEFGTVSVAQGSAGQWHTVNLAFAYADPIVVMAPASNNDAAPMNVRVRNVSSQSFEFQLDEWDYLDGAHGSEDVSYLVVEAGSWLVPNGGALVAGRSAGIDAENPFVQVFPSGAFTQTPIVLAQIASDNEPLALTERMDLVDQDGFRVRTQTQEASGTQIDADEVHWIALDPGSVPGLMDAGFSTAVSDVPDVVPFTPIFSSTPHFLASLQTLNGADTAGLRQTNRTALSVEVFVQEEQSSDTEIGHVDEVVGWLAIEPGVSSFGLLPLFNQAPTVADPGPQVAEAGTAVSLDIVASDPDDDTLVYSAGGLPPGLDIDADTGRIDGTPSTPGVYAVSVTATDTSAAAASAEFDWTINENLSLVAFAAPPRATGSQVDYTAQTNSSGNLSFVWNFGDGTGNQGPFSTPGRSHTFATPGRYTVTIEVTNLDTSAQDTLQFVQNVHRALTADRPTRSSSIAYESTSDRIWVVNPDNDSVSAIDATTNTRIAEIAVAAEPRSVAVAGDGRVWVVSKSDARVQVIDPSTLNVVEVFDLPVGSQPHGLVFNPAGSEAFVALEALGRVLRLDGSDGTVLSSRDDLGTWVRHLSVTADGSTVYVTRFITPPLPGEEGDAPLVAGLGGEILPLDAATLAPASTVILAASNIPQSEQAGPGIPNYVGAAAISPDDFQIYVPSKQDHIRGGRLRENFDLGHDSTVRAITSRVIRSTNSEDLIARIDHDDASIASATEWGPTGSYAFTALEGNRSIAIIDAFSSSGLGRIDAGRAVQGLILSPDGRTLYADNFMDRTVTVYDLSPLLDFDDANLPIAATISKVALETLASDVLTGKQLFYDAFDPRLSQEAYMACASCHNAAGHDGRTWDFTQFGEGVRNTITLRGRGQGHGMIHWSANFDEIQDFEGQIRGFAGGSGLMSDFDFLTGSRSDPLGDPKAGISPDLDALAAYLGSLTEKPLSPFRPSDGRFSPEARNGEQLFAAAGCASCHSGSEYTDSATAALHDVGTAGAFTGASAGLDTPTLHGLWETAPYLHDGSAATIADAVLRHDGVTLGGTDLSDVVAFLRELGSTVLRSVWDDTTTPTVESSGDSLAVELGVRFRTSTAGSIQGVRFYKGAANTGTHVGSLWAADGTLLAQATFSNETASGWQDVSFAAPVAIQADTTYVASYHAPNGNYAYDNAYFASSGVVAGPLELLSDAAAGGNGLYQYSGTPSFPQNSFSATNYWVDVLFAESTGPDTTPPTVVATTPVDGAVNVPLGVAASVGFSEAMNAATIDATTVVLLDALAAPVAGSVAYDPATRQATFTPSAALDSLASYTLEVRGGAGGIADVAGIPLATDTVVSFVTGDGTTPAAGAWDDTTTPTVESSGDSLAIELGVRFRTSTAGSIQGVRFYKGAANTGTHVGSLWAADGTLLAQATFSNETASGWQDVSFAAPVAIQADTTYVASYHAPNGNYAYDSAYFASSGVVTGPLELLSDAAAGGNGLYQYSGTPSFPQNSFSATNYWVDVLFAEATGPDTTPPTVVATTPVDGAVNVPLGVAASVGFSEAMNAATIDATTVVLLDALAAPVAGSVAYDPATRQATFTPSAALDSLASYTLEVRGGAGGIADVAGIPLATDTVVSFVTGDGTTPAAGAWDDTTTPTVESSGDSLAVELGVRFRTSTAGSIQGVRFYKGAANTGTHVGSLWAADGTLLAQATFSNETASGWQDVSFAAPVAIQADTTYVASYHAPNGNYAYDNAYFASSGVVAGPLELLSDAAAGGNGLYQYSGTPSFPQNSFSATNYWVDVLFAESTGPDTTPPTVVATTPVDGAVNVPLGVAASVGFSEPIDPASLSGTTVQLREAGGTPVASSLSLSPGGETIIVSPATLLDPTTSYQLEVVGGPGGVRDVGGNELGAGLTIGFTTTVQTLTVWSSATTPSVEAAVDFFSIEVGVKFTTDIDGSISGIRFYKGVGNSGTHVASLWAADGTLLERVDVTNETAAGWQEATFASDVPIQAGVVYVASYHAPNGHYAVDTGFFSSALEAGPINLLQDGASGNNGLFEYGLTSVFPTSSFDASNYWVAPVFKPAGP